MIMDECTGIYEIFVYTAAVLAFPTGMKKKAVGIAFGIPLLVLLILRRANILRNKVSVKMLF